MTVVDTHVVTASLAHLNFKLQDAMRSRNVTMEHAREENGFISRPAGIRNSHGIIVPIGSSAPQQLFQQTDIPVYSLAVQYTQNTPSVLMTCYGPS